MIAGEEQITKNHIHARMNYAGIQFPDGDLAAGLEQRRSAYIEIAVWNGVNTSRSQKSNKDRRALGDSPSLILKE